MATEHSTAGDGRSRLRRAWTLVGAHVRRQRRNFVIAVCGSLGYSLGAVASSIAIRWVTDHVIVERFDGGEVPVGTVVAGVAMIIGVGLVRAVSVVIRRVFATRTNFNVAASLSTDVVDSLTRQPVSWHGRRPDGDLVGRASVDADAAVSVMSPLPFAVGTVALLVVASVWLVITDVPLALVAFAVFPLLLVVNVRFQRRVDVHFDRAQDQLGLLSAGVHESFDGVQLVKAYGAERRETERLAEIAGRVRDSRTLAVRLRASFEAFLDAIPAIANVVLVFVGALRVRSGAVTIGELTSFVYLFTLLVFPIRLVGYALSELPYSWAGWQRVREVADEPIEPDPAAAVTTAAAEWGLCLDGVSFAYPDEPPTLHGIDLAVPTGTITAVVGATGSGKSTLAAIAAGLRQPSTGSVATAAGQRALVFQEAYLLSGTLRDNITLGEPFADDRVGAALTLAGAERFVAALPGGLDTVVGERGVSLSGGQRQRVALARALVRRPSLLLLDDVTSALDPATERAVLDNLRTALGAMTVLMVASRPSTIALADQVAFVAAGRIVDHGRHDELLGRNHEYRELVDAFDADRRTPSGEELVGAGISASVGDEPVDGNRVGGGAAATTTDAGEERR